MEQRDYDKRAVQRFYAKLDAPDENGCRRWMGKIRRYSKQGPSKGKPSYGVLWYDKKEILAHIFAARKILGYETTGMHVSHTCHNKWCCNPGHLIIETPAQNAARSVAVGHYGLEAQGRSRMFDEEQVRDIRRMYVQGWTQWDLAEFFECSQGIISRVVRRALYKDIA